MERKDNAIRDFLKKNGITVQQFSDATEISYETSRKIIYGYTTIPSIQSMKKINDAYPELDPNAIYKNLIIKNKKNKEKVYEY